MGERRSLGAALKLPAEQEAFIRKGVLPEPASKDTARREPTSEDPPNDAPELQTADEVGEEPTAELRKASGRRRRRGERLPRNPRESFESFPGITNLLVPFTTRLQPATYAAFKRAVLEQQLHGREPSKAQEIAEDAIATWLRENRYLAR